MKTFFSSESVTCGHPDKICDQISDKILDEILIKDPHSHVACEVTVTTNKVNIMGEIKSNAIVDYEKIARKTIKNIGYIEHGNGFDADTCKIEVDIHEQSPDILIGIERKDILNSGAGDQGMMFGFACTQTKSLMPLPIELAHGLTKRLEYVRKSNILPYLLPDGKAQVTVEYNDDKPSRISTVVLSTQHKKDIEIEQLRSEVIDNVIIPALPSKMIDSKTMFFVNPTGRFTIGGPACDTGLTGRKIIVDTYGGFSRHGGGAFSGKDPTKVDRSGAYLARYIAKNIVAADFCKSCEVQLSYAIGLADPVSIFIDTFGTQTIPVEKIQNIVLETIDLRPISIINRFGLRRPLYSSVSCYGHFGENAKQMPWEQIDMAQYWKECVDKFNIK